MSPNLKSIKDAKGVIHVFVEGSMLTGSVRSTSLGIWVAIIGKDASHWFSEESAIEHVESRLKDLFEIERTSFL